MKSKIIIIAVMLIMVVCVCCAGCTSTNPQETNPTTAPTVLATDKPTETPTVIPLSKDNVIGNWLSYNIVTENPYSVMGIMYCFKEDGTAFMSMFSSQDSELKTIKLIGNTSTSDILGNLKWKKVSDSEYEIGGKLFKLSEDSFTTTNDDGTVLEFKKFDVNY